VTVEPDHLVAELAAAAADAGVDPGSLVAFVVDAVRPPGATPIAYLQPAGRVRAGTVAVFRAVGASRAAGHEGVAHRLALWRELPGLPRAALAPMLRHELEHARRWERSGTAFYEADERLRATAGAADYAQLPTEREANAAAGAYARRVLDPAALERLAAVPELRALFAAELPHDVVGETLALLGGAVAVGPASLPPSARRSPLLELVSRT